MFWRYLTIPRRLFGLSAGLWIGAFTGIIAPEVAPVSFVASAQPISPREASRELSPETPLPPSAPETVEQTLLDLLSQAIPNPETEPPVPNIEVPNIKVPNSAENPSAETSTEQTFRVEQVEVLGSTVLQSEIDAIASQLEDRDVTLTDLQQLPADITQLYHDNSFITSGAFLPEDQDLTNGIVQVQVIEGTLEAIEVVGLRRLRESYVRNRVQLGASTPLNQERLAGVLLLLRTDPLFKQVAIEPIEGSSAGQTILRVEVEEAPAVSTTFLVDNYQRPLVGNTQGLIGFTHRNLLGGGDRAEVSLTLNEGLTLYNLDYTIPITPQGGKVNFSYENSDGRVITDDLRAFDIGRTEETVSVGVEQPVFLSANSKFGLGLSLDLRRDQTSLMGQPFSFTVGPEDGESNVTAIRFSQDWLRWNQRRTLSATSRFSFGIDAFDATVNDTGTDGTFFAWYGQFRWKEQVSPRVQLVNTFNTQLTPDSLLPLERGSIGGIEKNDAGTLRGYENDQIVADSGVTASLEALISLTDTPGELLLNPFIEAGTAWNNGSDVIENPTLASVGLGVRWAPTPDLYLRADYGIPLISVETLGNSLQASGLLFSLRYEPTW